MAERVVFSPKQDATGTWVSSEDVDFRELRGFIDACFSPGQAPALKPLLLRSHEGIRALIDLLESWVPDPTQDAHYLTLIAERAEREAAVARMSEQIPGLERDLISIDAEHSRLSNADDRVRSARKREKLRRKLSAVEDYRAATEAQIEGLRLKEKRFLLEHPSTFQEGVVQRLRGELKNYCGPLKQGTWDLRQTFEKAPDTTDDLFARTAASPPSSAAAASEPLSSSSPEAASPTDTPVLQPKPEEVPWNIIEPSGRTWEKIVEHYQNLSRVRRERYDFERLRYVHRFVPSEIFLGKAGFEGYVVFCFARYGRAVLECPKVGNATYFMQAADWKRLSRESKTELLQGHRREISRLVHTAQWKLEIRLWIESGGVPLFSISHLNSSTA